MPWLRRAYFISSELHDFCLCRSRSILSWIRPRGISRCLKRCVSEARQQELDPSASNSCSLNSFFLFGCWTTYTARSEVIAPHAQGVSYHTHFKAAAHPEAALEALADHVEGNWIDAGVHGRHIDADVVQHQEETKKNDRIRHPLACASADVALWDGYITSSRTWAARSGLDPSRRKWWASGCGWGGEAASTGRRPGPGRTLSWQPPSSG